MSSGDIPGFVDVIMNFDSPVMTADNILYQMKSSGKSIVFYGDDTWLKLFPSIFLRHEGVTSFFVSDYTEVRLSTISIITDDEYFKPLYTYSNTSG